MSTLQNLNSHVQSVQSGMNLWGEVAGFRVEWERRCRAVGLVICEERKITMSDGARLPLDTELGPRGEQAFAELLAWVREQQTEEETA